MKGGAVANLTGSEKIVYVDGTYVVVWRSRSFTKRCAGERVMQYMELSLCNFIIANH